MPILENKISKKTGIILRNIPHATTTPNESNFNKENLFHVIKMPNRRKGKFTEWCQTQKLNYNKMCHRGALHLSSRQDVTQSNKGRNGI